MRTVRSLLVVVVLFLAVAVSAEITLKRLITMSDAHSAGSVVSIPDSGYIIAGSCSCPDSSGALVARLDTLGHIVWALMFEDTVFRTATDIISTDDGNFVVCGVSYFGGCDACLVKVSPNGYTYWTRLYDIPYEQHIRSVCETPDGGFMLAGSEIDQYGSYLALVIRTDLYGDTLWTRTYGDLPGYYSASHAMDIEPTSDGCFVVAALSDIFSGTGFDDAWILKLDVNGDTIWTRCLGGADDDGTLCVLPYSDQYIWGAYTRSFGPDLDAWLIWTDTNGDTTRTRLYDWWGFGDNNAHYIHLVPGLTPTIAFGGPCHNWTDMYLVSMDYEGNVYWMRTYDIRTYDELADFTPVYGFLQSGFALFGGCGETLFSYDHLFLIKTDSLGLLETIPPVIESTTVWTDTTFLGPYPVGSDITDNVAVDSARIYENITHDYSPPDSVVGPRYFFTVPAGPHPSGSAICYFVEAWDISQNYSIDSMYCFNVITSVQEPTSVPTEFALHAPAPNPFNPTTRISFSLPEASHVRLEVFDLLGRMVATLRDEPMIAGEHEVGWNASGFSSGVYLVRLSSDNQVATAKLVLLK